MRFHLGSPQRRPSAFDNSDQEIRGARCYLANDNVIH
jgi:hypothetical protein